jgi:hypothetical protein
MTMAARYGSLIEVRHGPNEVITLTWWSGRAQAFIRNDDPDRKTLHRVTAHGLATNAGRAGTCNGGRTTATKTSRATRFRGASCGPEEADEGAMTTEAPDELIAEFREVCGVKAMNVTSEDGAFVICYPVTGFAADRLTRDRLRQIIDRVRWKAKRRQDADDALREGLS